MIIMSVDYGDARTGIAICDKFEMLASPVCVISEKNFNKCAQLTADKAVKLHAELIVVGLPKNMDGSEGERAKICKKFAKIIEKISKIPTQMWDERNTTVSAANYMNVTNTRGKKRKSTIDEAAATIILQSYLEYRKFNKENEK